MARAPKTTAQIARDRRRVCALLNFALVPLIAATVLTLASGQAPAGSERLEVAPLTLEFDDYADAPAMRGCRPFREGDVSATVAVVRIDNVPVRMGTDEAWERTHNALKADDVWVIGVCR